MPYWSRVPSIKTLMERLGIDKTKAQKIRALMKGEQYDMDYGNPNPREQEIDMILDDINKILNGHGVEHIENYGNWVNHWYQNTNLLYVNMGDTYTPTIVYDTEKEQFICGDWGSIVEKWN